MTPDSWVGKEFHVSGWGYAFFVVAWIHQGNAGLSRRHGRGRVSHVVPVHRLYPTHNTYRLLTGVTRFPAGTKDEHGVVFDFRCWASDKNTDIPSIPLPTNLRPGGCRRCNRRLLPGLGKPATAVRYIPHMGYAHYVNWGRWLHSDPVNCRRSVEKQLTLFTATKAPRRPSPKQEPIAADAGLYEQLDLFNETGSAFYL